MLDCARFFEQLGQAGFGFYAGVPDSLLKNFCFYVADHLPKEKHVITANEGSAIGLATGYHLATGRAAVVYLQNSGTGNALNPLLSLADPEVYSVPMLLLIGFRGEPGKKDEPQHKKQGRIMEALLASLEIPYEILGADTADPEAAIGRARHAIDGRSGPYVLLMQEGCFSEYQFQGAEAVSFELTRERAIEIVLSCTTPDDVVVCTTGKASRELFELRKRKGQSGAQDFLVVGSMGHASQIALGIALERPERRVFCIDGDGAVLMHAGGLATIGRLCPGNLVHIMINNGAHESVGGQSTGAFGVDFPKLARAFGYPHAASLETETQLEGALSQLTSSVGPAFLEVRTNQKSRKDLGRPTSTPLENKRQLMERLVR